MNQTSESQKPQKKASYVLMLHSHLPFYRKAGMWPFGEENLYECMAETYIPLLNTLNRLKNKGIKANITIGLTPVLTEQLADKHLQQGFEDYINARLKASREDVGRYSDASTDGSEQAIPHREHLLFLARYYENWFQTCLNEFNHNYGRNLVNAFRVLQEAGCIEITTSAATHGFLPLLGRDASIQSQLKTGVESYRRHFGQDPEGVWLPECAYRPPSGERPSIDAFVYRNRLRYFFTESTAIEGSQATMAQHIIDLYNLPIATPFPVAPEQLEKGLDTFEAYWMKRYPVAVMGRCHRASFQVWSAQYGYPGDGMYREFHKKDVNSGLHYWRLTSKETDLGFKMLYDPVMAENQARYHASHYAELIRGIANERYEETGEHQLIMVSFDTELFGHWWFEGLAWLEHFVEVMNEHSPEVDLETSGNYLRNHPPQRAINLPESTWGQGGHFWVWNNPDTNWMWPMMYQVEDKMQALVQTYQNENDSVKVRILNQAMREMFLQQSSDWPFLVTTVQAKDYAIERFQEHTDNFWKLANMLESGIDEGTLTFLEEKNNCFPEVDYHWYQCAPESAVQIPATANA